MANIVQTQSNFPGIPVTSIRQFLPQHFKTKSGFLNSLINAIDQNYAFLENFVTDARNQFYLSTAEGKYFLYLIDFLGFKLPANSGLDINAVRQIAPLMINDPKQITITLTKLLELFYSSAKTKPSIISSQSEPYGLNDADSLQVTTRVGSVEIEFNTSVFNDPNNVTAYEIAGYINSVQSEIFASVFTDKGTNQRYLQILSNGYGLGDIIQVSGGTAQNLFQFPSIIPTTQQLGTLWNLSKVAPYNDELRFTWDGTGLNPQVYQVKAGDILTIRGLDNVGASGVIEIRLISSTGKYLIDSAGNFITVDVPSTQGDYSTLNGTYLILDSGYDYFVIRNPYYQSIGGQVYQPSASTIFFTSPIPNRLYGQTEYAYISQTESDIVTVTVPAAPPIVKRFLQGSCHVHGFEAPITDFDRNSLRVDLTNLHVPPAGINQILLSGPSQAIDFTKKPYQSSAINGDIFIIPDSDSVNYTVLPFTTYTFLGNVDPIYCPIDESNSVVTFSFPHGLQNGWGVSFGDTAPTGGYLSQDLDKEFIVKKVLNSTQVEIDLIKRNQGVLVNGFDVYRVSALRSDGADFVFTFSNASVKSAANFQDATSVKLTSVGIDNVGYIATQLRSKKLQVVSQDNNNVYISSGLGVGSEGKIITSSEVRVAQYNFGGSNVRYFFDKNSTYNQTYILPSLLASFLDYTPSLNPAYVGSYIYDATGSEASFQLSNIIGSANLTILQGDSLSILTVTSSVTFPTSGYLYFDYGTNAAEGPVRYLNTITNVDGQTQIFLDPSYIFTTTHNVGAKVQFVRSITPLKPKTDGSDYQAYLTDPTEARKTLFTFVQELVAAGVFIDQNVILPPLKYEDSSISIFG